MIMSSQDVELTGRLLDVTNEAELDEFVTQLVVDAGRRPGHLLSPRDTRELVGRLTATAVRTLPTLSAVLGARGPGGSVQGESPVTRAARVFGLELEGLSAEDRDYEIAREFVRFAQAATAEVSTAETTPVPCPPDGPLQSGRWARRGHAIVLFERDPSRSEPGT